MKKKKKSAVLLIFVFQKKKLIGRNDFLPKIYFGQLFKLFHLYTCLIM